MRHERKAYLPVHVHILFSASVSNVSSFFLVDSYAFPSDYWFLSTQFTFLLGELTTLCCLIGEVMMFCSLPVQKG